MSAPIRYVEVVIKVPCPISTPGAVIREATKELWIRNADAIRRSVQRHVDGGEKAYVNVVYRAEKDPDNLPCPR